MPSHDELRRAYVATKKTCKNDWASEAAGTSILSLAALSLRFLASQSRVVNLVSRVPGKQYVSYKRRGIVARPANERFFIRSVRRVRRLWSDWQRNRISRDDFAALSYTVALAPCLAMELFDRQNKKGPATYFECFVGHMFARKLGQQPSRQVSFEVHGRGVRMTMDFLFEVSGGEPNIHLPVKMSTRERIVQAWSHQRLLDSAYGEGAYRGVMVLFSETKMDSRSLEVVEICVPDQWLAYQSLLARFETIYYFDIPARYQSLTEDFPEVIRIREFGELFTQTPSIVD
jgi:hypothetical protein